MSSKTFKETVLAMKHWQIVDAMLEGLKDPVVKVDMNSYGHIQNGICYGCAATNAVCKIAGKVPDFPKIESGSMDCYSEAVVSFDNKIIPKFQKPLMAYQAKSLGVDEKFIECFEEAIDALRQCDLVEYSFLLELIGIKPLPQSFIDRFDMYHDPIYNDNYNKPHVLAGYESIRDELKNLDL